MKLESALRYALERNEFEVYYQPRINVKLGEITGMEALLRWNTPTFGSVSPLTFIPLLEETGLIMAVGDWVLKTACMQTKIWHDQGYDNLSVSVNVSTRQFRQKDLDQRMREIWEECNFDPKFLELEITESVLVENMESAIVLLKSFHDMGVRISIDDFGTGYSSLSYLKRFPIDTLKIDRSFVRDVIVDIDDAVITEGIIALARSLKLQVVAEGVENHDQLNFLQNLNCDEVQGYHFSRPLASADFEKYLQSQQFSKQVG
jgi:EAL domain-containing protein (putative c-di-GMP-specific phosphodiesterase class I)